MGKEKKGQCLEDQPATSFSLRFLSNSGDARVTKALQIRRAWPGELDEVSQNFSLLIETEAVRLCYRLC